MASWCSHICNGSSALQGPALLVAQRLELEASLLSYTFTVRADLIRYCGSSR